LLIFYIESNRNHAAKVTQRKWFRIFIRFYFSCFKLLEF